MSAVKLVQFFAQFVTQVVGVGVQKHPLFILSQSSSVQPPGAVRVRCGRFLAEMVWYGAARYKKIATLPHHCT